MPRAIHPEDPRRQPPRPARTLVPAAADDDDEVDDDDVDDDSYEHASLSFSLSLSRSLARLLSLASLPPSGSPLHVRACVRVCPTCSAALQPRPY